MSVLRGWLEHWFSWDRRKAERQALQGLVAYYWTGAVSVAKCVRDISSHGLYLLTDDRWYPGTMIRITLQKTNEIKDDLERSITLQAKVVRSDVDGVGLVFLLSQDQELSHQQQVSEAVDRKKLDSFLAGIRAYK